MYRLQIGLLAASILLYGCATSAGLRTAPIQAGTARIFSGEFEQVLKAAKESMLEVGLSVEDSTKVNDHTYLIVGSKGLSAFSYGELVRLIVEETDPSEITVRVYTKRRLATNVTAKGDYSKEIFARIESKLLTP